MEDNIKGVNVVVGGGIAGILAAFLLSEKGNEVVLVEKNEKLGGLLNSKQIDGLYFDHGTHLLRKTGIADLDNFLYTGLDFEEFKYVKSGSFHNSLFDENGFLTDKSLHPKSKSQCLEELINSAKSRLPGKVYSNLEDQLIDDFGLGYYENLLSDIIKKYFYVDPKELAPNSHLLFGLGRIVVADRERAKDLKNDPNIDRVVAHASYLEGISSLNSLYPRNGGVGKWIELLEKKLIDLGVIIYKGENFNLDIEHNEVVGIQISSDHYSIRNLYWTVPPFFLYKSLGLKLPASSPPKRLSSIIVDLQLEGNYNTDLYYFQVFDPSLSSFRVTLYDNYDSSNKSGRNRITVEFLVETNEIDSKHYAQLAIKELVLMGVADRKDKLTVVNVDVISDGFPVPTTQFLQSQKALILGLDPINNVTFLGKAKGDNWFMNDVLKEVYQNIK